MPEYQKIRVLPTRVQGGLGGRGRHCDGRKVTFWPCRVGGKLLLRGMGYDSAHPEQKIYAHPVRVAGKLEFRTITQCLGAGCVECWTCSGSTPENIVEVPMAYTTVEVILTNFPGGIPSDTDCCQDEFDGVAWQLVACQYPSAGTLMKYWTADPFAECCNAMPSGMLVMAQWYEEFSGQYSYCDPSHPGDLTWYLQMRLRTLCDPQDEQKGYWAWLQMCLYTGVSTHENACANCCLELVNICSGEGYCTKWETCWQIQENELCGDFSTTPADLCCVNDQPGYLCANIDVALSGVEI